MEGQYRRLTSGSGFIVQVVEGVEICHSEHVIDVLVVGSSLAAQQL